MCVCCTLETSEWQLKNNIRRYWYNLCPLPLCTLLSEQNEDFTAVISGDRKREDYFRKRLGLQCIYTKRADCVVVQCCVVMKFFRATGQVLLIMALGKQALGHFHNLYQRRHVCLIHLTPYYMRVCKCCVFLF